MRKLREPEVVKLMFPSFDEEKHELPQGAGTCTGVALFEEAIFRDGQLIRRNAWPFLEQEGDITYGSGGDRLKIVWLRTHTYADGTVGGPLAVIRSGERFAELFAIGALRSHSERTKLGTARMGTELLVTAESDGCTGRKAGTPCQTVMSVLLPRRGKLGALVEVPLERVGYSGKAERGTMGVLEYHLTSVPEFRADAIRLVEQVRVRDDTGLEVRKSELERIFAIDDLGNAKASEPSLWDQAFKVDDVQAPPPRPREKSDAAAPRSR